jgi:hypothetical protein
MDAEVKPYEPSESTSEWTSSDDASWWEKDMRSDGWGYGSSWRWWFSDAWQAWESDEHRSWWSEDADEVPEESKPEKLDEVRAEIALVKELPMVNTQAQRIQLTSLQSKQSAEDPEQIKNAPALPKLDKPTSSSSSTVCGDWLCRIKNIMDSLSSSSASWWKMVMTQAQEEFEKFSKLDRLARLDYKVEDNIVEDFPKYTLVAARGAAMLLEALDEETSADLVSTGLTKPAQIVFRILQRYQPGGVRERQEVLQKLQQPDVPQGVAELVKGLRQWQRHQLRAVEMGWTDRKSVV